MIKLNKANLIFHKGTPLEKIALNKISMAIDRGEFLTVLGGNGAGKSTLLNTLAGEYLLTSGQILIDGADVTNLSSFSRAEFVSRVFQDPTVGTCGDLTILENLSLSLYRGKRRSLRMSISKKIRDLFKEKLSILGMGLENRLDIPAVTLSGGQRQAMSLVMATISSSKILLLDEPTAALDVKMTNVILKLIHRLVEEQKITTLMVTHSMEQALEFGNRTIMLNHGSVVLDVKDAEKAKLTPNDLVSLLG